MFLWAIGTSEKKKAKVKEKFLLVGHKALRKNVFFGLIHVVDNAALTLKKGKYSLLSQHCLDIQNIQG